MPRHSKATKIARDAGFATGIKLRFPPTMIILGKRQTRAQIAAIFERHIDLLRAITELELKWRQLIREEAKMEAEIKDLLSVLDPFVRSMVGKAGLADFGLQPHRSKVPSLPARKRGLDKRRATLAARKAT